VARIGVAATAPFGADVLERLAERHEIAFVLTRPDAAQGRGRKTGAPPAKVTAERLGMPVLQPERLDASVELPVDTIVAVAYGLLVPPALLDRHTWLNVHPSLLPRWRGAAPVERAIMAGDEETGVSIIRLVEALDAGPIGAREAFPIGAEEDAGAVYVRAAEVAARLLDPPPESFEPQEEAGATYADKIGPEDRRLDLSRPADELVRRVRALSPHIGARAELNGRPVTVWHARVVEDGSFEPLEVQPEGGRRMDYAAWLRGLR
jgi:methionyl-tRNA formyltransferase